MQQHGPPGLYWVWFAESSLPKLLSVLGKRSSPPLSAHLPPPPLPPRAFYLACH